MKFSDELKKYIKILDCSPKDLSKATELSPTLISRYINDKRTPKVQSDYFEKLVNGIYLIASHKNIKLNKDDIFNTLSNSISSIDTYYNVFVNNFNTLLSSLKINISEIANAINYDTSFISRIKNGNRKPSDLNDFIDKIATYVSENHIDVADKEIVTSILKCSIEDLNTPSKYKELLIKWLSEQKENNSEMVKNFLSKLDTFNLSDYIGTELDKVKVPTSPVILRTSKLYYGPEGRKQSEADFLKTTIISKSKEPIYFYINLPMSKAAADEEFKKKWVTGISMVLKKGLHLNIIHDVDRPIEEMFLGLENWIPVYMSGSISPYYFKDNPDKLFYRSSCVSGSCALSGECSKSNTQNSKFYFTTKKEEVEYYTEKNKYIFSKALPLMTIYKSEDTEKFNEFLNKEKNKYEINQVQKDIFKNIDFYVNKGKWISVNKKTSPELHFVIHNPKLRDAIEKFL